MKSFVEALTRNTNNFVVIGEAGSGKTEFSLALSIALQEYGNKPVHFFDMDQTKPILRARDREGMLECAQVSFHYQKQYMDAPTVVSGVLEKLKDPGCIVVLDIGGGAYGSHMIGQFEEYLNSADTETLFLVNPYRPWSGSREDIDETMRRTIGAAHLGKVSFVANPNLGDETTAETVLEGLDMIRCMLPEYTVHFVCTENRLKNEVEALCDLPVFPLELNMLPEWLN